MTEREGEVPLWRAVDWEPVELSVVPVGADGGAGFRQGRGTTPCRLIARGAIDASDIMEDRSMNKDLEAAVQASAEITEERAEGCHPADEGRGASPGADAGCPAPEARHGESDVQATTVRDAPTADSGASTSEGTSRRADDRGPATDAAMQEVAERVLAAERERVAGIFDAARKLGIDTAVADELVRRGVPLDEARKALIDAAAERDAAIETRPHVRAGALDETETRRTAVEAALLHRFDPRRYELTEPAREWRGLSLIELARAFLEAEGVRVRGLSRDEVASRALQTTSDFPAILAAVTNRTLRDAYEAAPRTFLAIARRATAADFKEIHRLQLGEAPQLEKVNEAGEFKRGALGEAKESYRVETYGKVVAITRQVIVNDDLDAFTRVPALFGTAAATLESDVVWSIVADNPTMSDGKALFHASHKNLAATGTALDVASIGKARAAMAKQTGLDGKTVLNVRPAFLVVPSALELTAEQLVAQSLAPARSADVVPASIRSLAVIAEPRLDPSSGAVPWYLFASPSAIDTIEYAYLEGQEGVYIETRMGFDVDGVEIKARLDFGAKAIDWRGMYKNPGVTLT